MFETKKQLMRLRERLFGEINANCLNLMYGEGILGGHKQEIDELQLSIKELKEEIEALKPKKKVAKKTTKK